MKFKRPNIKFKLKRPSISFKKIKSFNYRTAFKGMLTSRFLLVILVLIIFIVNIISFQYFIRIDATDTKQFSLHSVSKTILQKLPEDVTIEVFFSDNIPPSLLEAKQNVLDTLDEFEKESKGKIKLEIKDPTASDFSSSASQRGIQQIQYSEFDDDKFSVAQGYLGIVFVKGDDIETIPVISSLENLEYEGISRILKLTNTQDVKVGFFTNFPKTEDTEDNLSLGQSVFSGYSDIQKLLERQYLTEEIDLRNGKPIDPKEFPVVVILTPRANLSERDLFELEQYLFKGGKLLILDNVLELSQSMPVLNKVENNLNDFLKNYGLELEDKTLLDESFTPIISANTRIAYPFWVLVGGTGINYEIPPLNTVESTTFLWANPIKKEEKSGLKYTKLFTTTDFAWVEEGDFVDIDFKEFTPTDQKKYTISYLVEGKASSRFDNVPVLANSQNDERTKDDEVLKESKDIKMIVIGDSDFISDNFMAVNEQNSVIFLNLVDWLTNTKDLSDIRSKVIKDRPLETLSSETRNTYKILNSAFSPIIISLVGIVYLRRRKKKKSSI